MDRALVKMDDTFRLGYVCGIMQAKTGAFYRHRGGIFVQSDIYIIPKCHLCIFLSLTKVVTILQKI